MYNNSRDCVSTTFTSKNAQCRLRETFRGTGMRPAQHGLGCGPCGTKTANLAWRAQGGHRLDENGTLPMACLAEKLQPGRGTMREFDRDFQNDCARTSAVRAGNGRPTTWAAAECSSRNRRTAKHLRRRADSRFQAAEKAPRCPE